MPILTMIEKKKQGLSLSPEELREFARGAADGTIPDYQLSALLMAIRLRGMNREETVRLTQEMADSGEMMDLSAIGGVPVDKHSTGGVGDTTTLILAPLVAACGVPVAKMSGRGLGHTGGTLDKLESISGMRVEIDTRAFLEQVQRIGVAVVGQSPNLAPADKALYALRDVTGTVDSLPLIASSIMSKKLASGAQGIVLDVKTGSGALMATEEGAIELAQIMVRIGVDAGRVMAALITDMDQPLGMYVGNALEVRDAIDVLSGRTKGRLLDVSLQLGAQMLLLGGGAKTQDEAMTRLRQALESGAGLAKLGELIAAQGGDRRVCDDPLLLPQAPLQKAVPALQGGYVAAMDTRLLGEIAQELGAGRKQKTDVIDPAVGYRLMVQLGDEVKPDDALAIVHARTDADADAAAERLRTAITLSSQPVAVRPIVRAFITADEIIRY